jgi:hypothetical protein
MPYFEFEYCTKCSVPGLMKTIEASRKAEQTSNAIAKSSESPIQGEPFRQEAQIQGDTLFAAIGQLSDFTKSGSKCQACPV